MSSNKGLSKYKKINVASYFFYTFFYVTYVFTFSSEIAQVTLLKKKNTYAVSVVMVFSLSKYKCWE